MDQADTILLSEVEKYILQTLASSISSSPCEDLFLNQVDDAVKHLPYNLTHRLASFVRHGSSSGYLHISKIILSDIPPTPLGNQSHIGETTELARIQAIFNQAMGEMISYEAEGGGRLFQDMVPKLDQAQTQTSLSSGVELELHTEQAFSQLRPDILSLACLRGNPSAKTYILHVSEVLSRLPPEKIRLLWQPLWMIGVDRSFKMNNIDFIEGDIRGPLPILSGPPDDPIFRFDQDLMTGITEEAEDLKREIIAMYYSYRKEHVLEPGELIFVDNRRTVHGRSSFQAHYTGTDRFIIRSFVTFDLEKSAYARLGSRMILAKYS